MKCEKCNAECTAMNIHSNPPASEWYCSPCHKSYPMHAEDVEAFNDIEVRARMARRTK